jgi:hypothetical protein
LLIDAASQRAPVLANNLNRKADSSRGKHREIAHRYAWQVRSKNSAKKPDRGRLLTLVRMRELERVFQHRYGRFLPDDDSGSDDFTLMAHHIAQLPGDALPRIVAWARALAPWMPPAAAEDIARRVMENPARFTADVLAWRLRLSMADRTVLKITTIGAFDVSKAEREEERRRKDRERKQAARAKKSIGRPRGRPRKSAPKNASAAVRAIAADGFSDRSVDQNSTTTPPAIAVGIPNKRVIVTVDAAGVGGHPSRRYKTRVPTAMRLDGEIRQYAVDAGFETTRIANMFEIFKSWNAAKRSYSDDWTNVWFDWVDRQVEFDMERFQREKQRASGINI